MANTYMRVREKEGKMIQNIRRKGGGGGGSK